MEDGEGEVSVSVVELVSVPAGSESLLEVGVGVELLHLMSDSFLTCVRG